MMEIWENRIPSFLIGLAFITFLILDMIGKGAFSPLWFALAVALLGALIVDFVIVYRKHLAQIQKETEEKAEQYRLAEIEAEKLDHRNSIPTILARPIEQEQVFHDLADFMKSNNLELRLRRADGDWNVTFLHVEGRVVKMVGTGSAAMILDALIKAEADFLEKE